MIFTTATEILSSSIIDIHCTNQCWSESWYKNADILLTVLSESRPMSCLFETVVNSLFESQWWAHPLTSLFRNIVTFIRRLTLAKKHGTTFENAKIYLCCDTQTTADSFLETTTRNINVRLMHSHEIAIFIYTLGRCIYGAPPTRHLRSGNSLYASFMSLGFQTRRLGII